MSRASTRTAKPSSVTALYQQVKDYIIAQIRKGALAPGHTVPSEQELCRILGVSRMTANRAVRELADTGVLSRIAGVGTFVASPRLEGDLLEVRDIATEIRARGGRYSAQVRVMKLVKAPVRVIELFGISARERVFHSVVIHLENGQPVQLEDRYVNPNAAPQYLGVDLTTTTATTYLSGLAPMTDVQYVIEAILPDKATQNLLRVPAKEPCIRLYGATSSFRRNITCVWLTYAGRRHRMTAHFSLQNVRGEQRRRQR